MKTACVARCLEQSFVVSQEIYNRNDTRDLFNFYSFRAILVSYRIEWWNTAAKWGGVRNDLLRLSRFCFSCIWITKRQRAPVFNRIVSNRSEMKRGKKNRMFTQRQIFLWSERVGSRLIAGSNKSDRSGAVSASNGTFFLFFWRELTTRRACPDDHRGIISRKKYI